MAKYYYVGADSRTYGPVEPSQFAACGLTADSLVCPEGGQQWVPLGSIPGLSAYLGVQAPGYGQPYAPAGNYAAPQPGGVPPNNNMVWAILTTILCCLPFGIVAIVKASSVNNLWTQGRYDEARAAAKAAANWSIVAAVVSAVCSIIYMFVYGAALIAALQ